ncbi:MAG: lactate racemase domain-containing protein [Candidatus Bathyarchaeota archaeon]|nr:lactate racemase domain-containing protein [Candidatus Bathyarchaeota archaeon]
MIMRWRLVETQRVDVRVNEHFGDDMIPLMFPDGWNVRMVKMACKGTPPMSDEEIRAALDSALGAPDIAEQARGKNGRIVVTCDDLSRPTPAYRVFPIIIEQLHEAGISDGQIFVLGSFGCHHPMNLDAFAKKIGEEAVARYDCVNHNPFENFENLGRTSRGTPLLVNKEFASADLRICISGVKKHIWAGAGGGGKAVIPGVSSIETIFYNHGVIEGHRPEKRRIWWIRENPERLDMQEAARMADLNVSVNCVYDGSRNLIGLAAGDVDDAWREAVKRCYEAHDSRTAPESDVVVVNAYPQADQDIDWWGAQASLREGGTAVAVHHFPPGSALLHYRSEQAGAPWTRICGYPNRRWPVKQAGNVIVYTNRLSRRQMLGYDNEVEWTTEWGVVLRRLEELYGEDASVAVYPSAKLQFDAERNPLDI